MEQKITKENVTPILLVKDYVSKILTEWGTETEANYRDRCICLLKSASKAGFRYVQMFKTKAACAAKINIDGPNGYKHACNEYVHKDCGNEAVRITKE